MHNFYLNQFLKYSASCLTLSFTSYFYEPAVESAYASVKLSNDFSKQSVNYYTF